MTETNADHVNPLSEEEMERLRINRRYRQLGGLGVDPVAADSDLDIKTLDGEQSLGDMVVAGDADRAARLKRRIVPTARRYQVRGRVRVRID